MSDRAGADAGMGGAGAMGGVGSYGDWGMGGFLFDSCVMLVTQFVFFAMGWVFFMRKLFRDYEVCALWSV